MRSYLCALVCRSRQQWRQRSRNGVLSRPFRSLTPVNVRSTDVLLGKVTCFLWIYHSCFQPPPYNPSVSLDECTERVKRASLFQQQCRGTPNVVREVARHKRGPLNALNQGVTVEYSLATLYYYYHCEAHITSLQQSSLYTRYRSKLHTPTIL